MKKYVQSALGNSSHWLHRGIGCMDMRCLVVSLAFFVVLALSPVLSWGQGAECPAPADFNLMTPCYAIGSRAANTNEPIIVLWNHTASRGTAATKEILANYGEVGTVWGLAWHAQTKKLYVAAFLKRHADLSPDGLGAIYEIDLTTPTTAGAGTPTLWMNLNSATHLGAGATLFPSETAANRGLGASNVPSYDLWAFNRVGKDGLGDIDISADGTTMYVMDLTNRQVLEINMATKTVTNRYAVNTPAGYPNANDRRPFAVKHHDGQLYIGVVGSAESSYTTADKNAGKTDLRATIMRLNAGTFTTVFTIDSMGVEDPAFPGNTGRFTSYRGNPNFGTGLGWYANFTSDIAAPYYSPNDPNAFIQHPVPLISDIEFQNNGHMVIGIMDWTAHRYGNANYMPDPAQTDTRLKSAQAHGDVIQARWNGAAWVKEPGLGQFYDDMQAIPDPVPSFWPDDTYVGGLVVTDCNGTELAVANMQDPFTTNEGGVVWMRTSDGFMQTHTGAPADPNKSAAAVAASRLRIFTGGFGKAAGLGDMVAMFNPPCINPTHNVPTTAIGTCTSGTPNNNATITMTGIANADRIGISTGATYSGTPAYAAATPIVGAMHTFMGLMHNTQYTIRLFNGADNCFTDVTITTASIVCCPDPQTFCPTTGESFDLTAQAGLTDYRWYLNGNLIPGANAALYNTNVAGVYTWTALDGGSCPIGGCCAITLVEMCAPPCIVPANINITQTQATCNVLAPRNDGIITLNSVTNGTHYAISTAPYSGPTTIAAATSFNAGTDLPLNLSVTIPNAGGSYVVRIFNGADNCFIDVPVSVSPVICTCPAPPCGIITVTKN